MNDKFYELPIEKQQRILNAGYEIFSQNKYKKSSVLEITDNAGISKSLLFHYFKNKKEFYVYLWNRAIELTREQLEKNKIDETDDLFEMLSRSMHSKCELMRIYPYIAAFTMRAYFETEKEIADCIRFDFDRLSAFSEAVVLKKISRDCFLEGTDFKMLYQEMIWASDGYLHMAYAKGALDADKIEKDFEELISFWRKMYGRI